MRGNLRNSIYIGLIVGLLAVVIVGLIPRESTPETPADRSHRIASQLRCPFCSGESIADAQSAIAGDLKDLIDEQVAGGMTDDEIFDYYVAIYTDRVLLSPPLLGWGLVLWALPLLLLGAGLAAVLRRRRRELPLGSVASIGSVASLGALEEARRVVAADLADVELQEASGELDEVEASRLRDTYEAERATLRDAEVAAEAPPTSRRRVMVGAAILIVGAVALTIGVVVTINDRDPGDLITGGIAGEGQERDLTTVTNEEMEEVVAANPDVVPMRLALAARYFNEGDFSAALGHYLEVLDREPHPEALANIGWMTYLSGDVATGLLYVERSLEVTKDLPQSHWFLANIRYVGLADAAGAVEPLETLLAFDGLPDEIRAQATTLLSEVRAAL